MLELDGDVYPFVKTTKDNTDDIVDFINQYAEEHNIVDAKGNKINIDKNKANTLYMTLFGVGYLATILQRLIRSAADSNSVQNSSAKQLDLLAETMHTTRNCLRAARANTNSYSPPARSMYIPASTRSFPMKRNSHWM